MARIAGVNIPTNKRVLIALQYIHGIGPKSAEEIVKKINLPAERRVSQLTDQEVLQIREMIDRDYMVERPASRGRYRHQTADDSAYRGLRHRQKSAGARSAHSHQRPHPQGPGEGNCRQEEVIRRIAIGTQRVVRLRHSLQVEPLESRVEIIGKVTGQAAERASVVVSARTSPPASRT